MKIIAAERGRGKRQNSHELSGRLLSKTNMECVHRTYYRESVNEIAYSKSTKKIEEIEKRRLREKRRILHNLTVPLHSHCPRSLAILAIS